MRAGSAPRDVLDLEVIVTPGLGDNSYSLTSGDETLLVDPQRDVGRMLAAATARRSKVRYVLETHVHNDYVSGAAEAHAATGAEILGPSGSGYAFPFRPLEDGAEIVIGDLQLIAMETPGHTPAHLSFVVLADGAPVAVFTGGSLMVGSAGRTDLLGPEMTEELTFEQFGSLRRLAELADEVSVLPTHGAGSFCATSTSHTDRTSTIGRERAANPALAHTDAETFARDQLSAPMAYPEYYKHMAPINRAGPRVFGGVPEAPALSVAEFADRARDAHVVDGRDGRSFADVHMPGTLSIPMEEPFASYVGWLVPFGAPVLLILPDSAERTPTWAVTELFRIGYERVEGYLAGGLGAWRSEGRAVGSYPVAGVDDLVEAVRTGSAEVLDVRQRSEWDAGHLDGSRHVFVGELPDRIRELPSGREILTACASGFRASMAASVLAQSGIRVRLVAPKGVPAALRRLG